MAIHLKSPSEIQLMKQGGRKLSLILADLFKMVEPGVNLLTIEKRAVQLIKETGGEPAFQRVPGYNWATCLNINEEIVHGVPKDYQIKKGDVVNIDIGLYYRGFNTDMSGTIYLPPPQNKEVDCFLQTGRKALEEAKKQAKAGNRVGHISQKIQQIIEKAGYNCARNLTGHGIGRELHQEPMIPCWLKGSKEATPLLKEGMAIAIEVIYTQGKKDLVVDSRDKWTIRTKDGKISAVFEETIIVTNKDPIVITKLPI